MSAEQRVEFVDLDTIEPDPRNAKQHRTDLIAESIDRHGFVEVPTVDERTGRLVAGHGRIDALRARRDTGGTAPDGVRVAEDGSWLVPVLRGWRSADDAAAAAYLVASNRLTEVGGWDDAGLASLLRDLEGSDAGLVGTGYDTADLAALLVQVDAHERQRAGVTDEEEPAVREVEQRVSRGDVWQLGPHRVMCGDCRNPDDVAVLVDGRRVNLAVTSPPYAEQRKYDESSGFRPIPPDEYVDWFEAVQANVAAVLAADGSWLVNIKEHCEDGQRVLYVKDLTLAHVRRWGWRFVDEFCWRDTRNGVPGGWGNRLKDAWEPCFHFSKSAAIKFRPWANATPTGAAFDYSPATSKASTGSGLLGSSKGLQEHEGVARPSNVIELASSTTGGHSAPFPVGLPEFFTRLFTDEHDVVFDPFCGSGSSILAAHNTNRVGLGLEISAGYCDIILDRFERHTGIVPALSTPAALPG